MEEAYHILTHHHKHPLHETRAFLHLMLKHAGLTSKYHYHSLHEMIRALYHHLPAHKPLSLEQRQSVLDMVKTMPKKTQGRALHWTTHVTKIPLTFLFHSGLIYFPLADEDKKRASLYLKNEKELLLEGMDPDDPKLRHAGKLYRILTQPALAHALAEEYDTVLKTVLKDKVPYEKPEIDDVSRCGECHDLMELCVPKSPLKNMNEQEMIDYLTSKGYNVTALQNRDYETFFATAPAESKSGRKMIVSDSKAEAYLDGQNGAAVLPAVVPQTAQMVQSVPGGMPMMVQQGPATAYVAPSATAGSTWYNRAGQWMRENPWKAGLGVGLGALGATMYFTSMGPLALASAGIGSVYEMGKQMLVATGLQAGAQAVLQPTPLQPSQMQLVPYAPNGIIAPVSRPDQMQLMPYTGMQGTPGTSLNPNYTPSWGTYLSDVSTQIQTAAQPYVLPAIGGAVLAGTGYAASSLRNVQAQQSQIDAQYRQELLLAGVPANQLAVLNSAQLADLYNQILVKQTLIRQGNQAPMDPPEINQMRQWLIGMSNQGSVQIPVSVIQQLSAYDIQRLYVDYRNQLAALGFA